MRVKLDKGAFMPTRAYKYDAGYDLRTPEKVHLDGGAMVNIDTGVHIEIPRGYAGLIKSKSGLYTKHGITADGLIDSGFTGSIMVRLVNHSDSPYVFDVGDKITQIVFVSIITPELEETDSFDDSDRGEKGYGSSGRQ